VLDKKKVRSKVWHPKSKAGDKEDDKPQADINMVAFLPKEFMTPVDSDVSDEQLGMTQLTLKLNKLSLRNQKMGRDNT
jgi:hypothetical protein